MANDYYYHNDPEDNKSYQRTVALCVAAASLVVLLFLVFLYMNSKDSKSANSVHNVETVETSKDDILSDSHNFTSDELDFWKDSKIIEEEVESEIDADDDLQGDNIIENDTNSDKTKPSKPLTEADSKRELSEAVDKSEENVGEGSLNKADDDADDSDMEGKLQVSDDNGNKKYYEILSDVPKCDYNLEEKLTDDKGFLEYKDSKRHSVTGIDLSKYNGSVDFGKVKGSGIDFAMLRLGSRGYESGIISLDDKFVEYAQNAVVNNIPVGVYFFSSAINETEAVEEANYTVGAITSFTVRYPVAIDLEDVGDNSARTANLTMKERTAIVKAFCDTVKSYGYKPIIYAERDMLIAGVDLEELKDYDIWLADENIPTDFPYDFKMWQYSQKGQVDGISGDVDINLSFVSYEDR